jgi:hypothetical protein
MACDVYFGQKIVSNKHMGGCLRPSVGTATKFKNFQIILLKATTFSKIHLHYKIRILSFSPIKAMVADRISMEQACGKPQINRKNWSVRFYLPFLWGSRPVAKNWRADCSRGSR